MTVAVNSVTASPAAISAHETARPVRSRVEITRRSTARRRRRPRGRPSSAVRTPPAAPPPGSSPQRPRSTPDALSAICRAYEDEDRHRTRRSSAGEVRAARPLPRSAPATTPSAMGAATMAAGTRGRSTPAARDGGDTDHEVRRGRATLIGTFMPRSWPAPQEAAAHAEHAREHPGQGGHARTEPQPHRPVLDSSPERGSTYAPARSPAPPIRRHHAAGTASDGPGPAGRRRRNRPATGPPSPSSGPARPPARSSRGRGSERHGGGREDHDREHGGQSAGRDGHGESAPP